MTGYVRQDTSNNIADGNVINAADFDSEFDGLQAAFNASTGHVHDGTTGNGAPILVVGPTQDVVVSATAVTPKTTNTVDIGSSSLKFKDIFITGTATLPTVSATTVGATTGNITTVNATTVDTTNIEVTTLKAKDGTAAGSIADSTGVVTLASSILTTADINGGTIDGTAIGASSASTGAFTTLTASSTATLNTLASSGATLTGGSINNMAIGGTTAAAASVTTLTTSSTVTHNGGTANGVAYLNGSKVLTTGSALTFDGTNLFTLSANAPKIRVSDSGIAADFGLDFYFPSIASSYGQVTLNGSTGGMRFVAGKSGSTGYYQAFELNGSEAMRLTSTGLGIGTSSILSKLVVSNAGAQGLEVQPGALTYLFTYNRSTSSYTPLDIAGDYLRFSTGNAAEKMRIDSSGNLGLGVTPSAWAAYKATQVGWSAFAGYAAADTAVFSNAFFDGGYKYIGNGFASQYRQINSSHQWFTAPSGTAGNAISFTQAMTLDASGNLGIGTSSPITQLHVVGGIYTKSGTLPAPATSATNSFSVGNTTGLVQFASNGQNAGEYGGFAFIGRKGDSSDALTRVTIDSSGNLGLGVTPSAWDAGTYALQFNGAALYGFTGGANLTQNAFYGGAWKYVANGAATYYSQLTGAHKWFTAPSGTAGNAISFTQAMTLDASGNLIIGATSAAQALHVARGSGVSSFSTFRANGSTSGALYGQDSSNNAYCWNESNAVLLFGTNNTERARIDSSGNLLVGTTSNYTAARIAVERSNADLIGLRGNSVGSGIRYDTIQGTGTVAYFTTNSNTQVAGYITISGTSATYATSSDYRLKEDIQPMTGALAKVAALKPVTYKWKVDGSTGEGFIAHELAEVCPAAVTCEKDAVNEDGSIKPQGIDTSFLVATLTAAIQEQQAIINDLRARVAQLESN